MQNCVLLIGQGRCQPVGQMTKSDTVLSWLTQMAGAHYRRLKAQSVALPGLQSVRQPLSAVATRFWLRIWGQFVTRSSLWQMYCLSGFTLFSLWVQLTFSCSDLFKLHLPHESLQLFPSSETISLSSDTLKRFFLKLQYGAYTFVVTIIIVW